MEIETDGAQCIIRLPQYFNAAIVKDVVQLAHQGFDQKPASLAINFANTEMIDSSGIGSLVSLAKESKARKIRLVLRNLNTDLYQLFLDTDLDKIFDIETETGTNNATVNLFEHSAEIRLDIRHEVSGTAHIMHLSGIMNHPHGSRYFKREFLLALADSKKILINLEELTFFDSLSVGDILGMNKLLKETGGSLRICGANYIVSDLFSTLNINQVVPCFGTTKEALISWETA